jgi:polyadenylate-binding protein
MNFTDIKGRPCRIMWSQRDPSLRKSGVGNVFVKNLPPNVDNKGLFDTFSVFGNILSCKVAMDENGISKGYGYVHYETAEAAQDAIQKFNGNFIDDTEVYVGPFVRKQERASTVNWTNLYAKQFPTSWDEDKLKEVFGAYGTIASVFLMRDAEEKSKGFAFINYEDHEAAEIALKELNGKIFPDPNAGEGASTELYVNRAQKRAERQRDIKNKLEAIKEDRVSKYQGMNLYVKNIDDSVSDELFRETFAKFGTVTSARIMRDAADGASKGFGFVCFSTVEEASRAVTELNNKLLRSKPLTVTFHQRKEVRRAQLAASYGPRGGRFPQGGPASIPLPYMPIYMSQPGQPNSGYQGQPGQPRPYGGAYQGQPQTYPRGATASPRAIPFTGSGRGSAPANYPYVQSQIPLNSLPTQSSAQAANFPKRVVPGATGSLIPPQQQQSPGQQQPPGQPQGAGMQPRPRPMTTSSVPIAGPRGMPAPGRGYTGMQPPPQMIGIPPNGMNPAGISGPGRMPTMPNRGVNFHATARNQPMAMQAGVPPQMMGIMPQQMPGPVQMSDTLDDQALAAADPQMQKNMLGERLYPLIYVNQPVQAGKITGMLLEMDNAELLNLIESPDALKSKIEEALTVLRNHNASSAQE